MEMRKTMWGEGSAKKKNMVGAVPEKIYGWISPSDIFFQSESWSGHRQNEYDAYDKATVHAHRWAK